MIIAFAIVDCVISEVIAVPLLVILIVSVVFGRVNVPFAENVERMCVWFIGVTPVVDAHSCKTGCDDNSIPIPGDGDDDIVLVVVVLLVVAAAGVVVLVIVVINITIIATASMKIVAAMG
jgi:hypothetical protein